MAARTEREIVLEQTNLWFQNSEWSIEKFASEKLAPALAAADLVEPLDDAVTGDEYLRSRKAWGQRLNRIFNGTAPFPLEWKAVWLQCLPAPYGVDARRECLALYGVLDLCVPQLAPAPVPSVPSHLDVVTIEFGQFLAASRPAHNGRYDRSDDPAEVDTMLREGTDVVLTLIKELTAIAAGTGRHVPDLMHLFGKGAR
jgi:hypothetical protein